MQVLAHTHSWFMFSLDLLSVFFLVAGGVLLLLCGVVCLIFLLLFVSGLFLFGFFPPEADYIIESGKSLCASGSDLLL